MLLAQTKLAFVRACRAAAAFLKTFERRYEPSKHYMRGPGPKAREVELKGERSGASVSRGLRPIASVRNRTEVGAVPHELRLGRHGNEPGNEPGDVCRTGGRTER